MVSNPPWHLVSKSVKESCSSESESINDTCLYTRFNKIVTFDIYSTHVDVHVM